MLRLRTHQTSFVYASKSILPLQTLSSTPRQQAKTRLCSCNSQLNLACMRRPDILPDRRGRCPQGSSAQASASWRKNGSWWASPRSLRGRAAGPPATPCRDTSASQSYSARQIAGARHARQRFQVLENLQSMSRGVHQPHNHIQSAEARHATESARGAGEPSEHIKIVRLQGWWSRRLCGLRNSPVQWLCRQTTAIWHPSLRCRQRLCHCVLWEACMSQAQA